MKRQATFNMKVTNITGKGLRERVKNYLEYLLTSAKGEK